MKLPQPWKLHTFWRIKIMKFSKIVAVSVLALGLASCGNAALTFEGRTLEKGKVGVEYTADISTGDKEVSYEVDYSSELPAGLELSGEGVISGIPQVDGKFTFNLVAVKGEKFTMANFSLEIEGGELSYAGSTLREGTVNKAYLASVNTATGSDKITYKLKAGETLPGGLVLSEAGEISGTPTEECESKSFVVLASAAGCKDAEATFSITIKPGKQIIDNLDHIVYEGKTLDDGEVGEEYYQDLASAYGVKGITYKVKYVGGLGFPKGLKLNNGILTGTPTDSTYGKLHFQVIASADGFDSVTADFYVEIKDKYQKTDEFEAEYIYVDNLVGAGYSGSNSGRNMIQTFQNASNKHVIGYLNAEVTLTFHIQASETTSAKLSMTLGTENGDMVLDKNTFAIAVNDAAVEYGSVAVDSDGANQDIRFHEHEITPTIQLQKGDNVLTFTVKKVASGEGTSSARGPLFDKINLKQYSGETGWRPKLANIK